MDFGKISARLLPSRLAVRLLALLGIAVVWWLLSSAHDHARADTAPTPPLQATAATLARPVATAGHEVGGSARRLVDRPAQQLNHATVGALDSRLARGATSAATHAAARATSNAAHAARHIAYAVATSVRREVATAAQVSHLITTTVDRQLSPVVGSRAGMTTRVVRPTPIRPAAPDHDSPVARRHRPSVGAGQASLPPTASGSRQLRIVLRPTMTPAETGFAMRRARQTPPQPPAPGPAPSPAPDRGAVTSMTSGPTAEGLAAALTPATVAWAGNSRTTSGEDWSVPASRAGRIVVWPG